MDAGKCPSCGTPLGSGMLAGQCPRCLLGGDPRPQSTGDADAQKRSGGIAVLQASDGSGSAGDYAPPSSSAVVPARTDRLDDIDPDSHRDADVRPAPRPDPAATWSDRAPAPRIEGYEVLRELSQGGQGIVYLAVQRSTKRKVAVKVLLAGMFASKSARRRFEREVELVASLKHPNVIAVFDSGTTPDGHDFYVMDYVRGLPLTQYVREKGLGLEEVLNLFATTCEAVNHAHLRGVIHRDLKPSNLLVDHEGNVRVLDFGLAKALIEPAESIVSVTGHMVGTFPYMSPEQTRANPDEVDTRADVYALGVVLYEALTGKHPYPVTGNVADIVRHILETPPSPPARTWSGEGGVRGQVGRRGRAARAPRCPIDPDLETILLKALSKERERRYDNAGHFARDVRRYLANQPIVARRPSAGYQMRLFARRHRALVVASVGIFLGLVLGVIATTWVALELRSTNLQLIEANEAIGNFLAFGGDDRADNGDLHAASNHYLRALEAARGYGQSGSAILAGIIEIGTQPGGDLPLLGSYGGEYGTGVFRGHGSKPNNVAILHANRRALTGGDNGELILWDLDTGRRLERVMTGHKGIAYITVSPDRKSAVTAGEDGTVRRWRVDPLAEVEPLLTVRAAEPDAEGKLNAEPVWMVAISHDGGRILAGTNTGQIILREPDGTSRKIGECGESAAALAFLPGNSHFALSGDGNGCIRLWDLDGAREVWTEPLQQRGQVNSLVFSPDGTSVATASFGNTLVVWRTSGEGAEFRLEQRYDPIDVKAHLWRVAFSIDGKWVATAARGAGVSVYDAATGSLSRQFRAHRGDTMGLEFLDAETLVSTGDAASDGKGGMLNSALMVWDLRERPGVTVAGVTGLAVDDDGVVRVVTATGTKQFFIGHDGALHASGPGARAASADATDWATAPSWVQGGRSGQRPDRHADAADNVRSPAPSVELCKLGDGKVKLFGGADGTLQLWGTPKPAPGEPAGLPVPMRFLRGHKGAVTAAAVSRNGRYIVSADQTGKVLAWDLVRPLHCRELERRIAPRSENVNNGEFVPDPAALREWYAFRGREFPASPVAAVAPVGKGQ